MDKDIKVLFVGDIYINERFFKLDDNLKKIFRKHSLICCNFEGPLFNANQKPIIKAGPHLSQNKNCIKHLLKSGFNLFNISNNHIMDYGKDSLKKTLINLPNNSYFGAGLDFENAYKPLIKIIDNKKIGFLSFSEWGFGCFDNESKVGYSWIGHRNTNQLIKKTKKGVDLLIVQVHAGLEGIDLPLPEWRDKYKLLIDLGADIVIGHHPHVPQGCEKYKNKHIFYSLGNFYMDLSQKKKEKNFILSLELKESNNIRVEVIPIEMSNNIVKVVDDNDFINKLNRGLNSEEYYSKINEQCVTLWEERYKKYYFSSLNKLNVQMGIRYNIKKLLQFFLNKEIDDTLLLHNLKIESHRFAVERYLLLKNKEKNG